MKEYVRLFKALSDETRLRVMILISKKELCVCQIEDSLGLAQVKVSRHLAVLRHAGLVNVRREGLWMYYSLVVPRNDLEKQVFAFFRERLRNEGVFKKDSSNMKRCFSTPSSKGAKKAKQA